MTLRCAVLWTRLSGYFNGCLRAFADLPGTELFVASQAFDAATPFDSGQFDWIDAHVGYDHAPAYRELADRLAAFAPDAILISSWHIPAFRRVARAYKGKAVRILCMDNQWLGTAKQWLGVATAPFAVRPLYDYVFLPGDRQAAFAQKLGFRPREIWRGLYCCDQAKFSRIYRECREAAADRRAFLFVGRFVDEKGLDTLVEGYRRYRAAAADPWPMTICGAGPLSGLLEGAEGVSVQGFVQPDDLPEVMRTAACLVLPSRFEPWGVVVHEAVAAGLGVICTTVCGASVHLVQDGYNGSLVEAGDAAGLGDAMRRYAAQDPDALAAIADRSHQLSLQFTPERWAAYLHGRLTEIVGAGA